MKLATIWDVNDHYRGGFMQDVDVNQVPGDADNDGICMYDQATLDYGVWSSSRLVRPQVWFQ